MSFCIYEIEHHLSPINRTADFVYIRLHGPGEKYKGSYSQETLYEWAKRLRRWAEEGHDVYCYFDNDQNAYAAFNASSLIQILQKNYGLDL